jgi:hypothetical protein
MTLQNVTDDLANDISTPRADRTLRRRCSPLASATEQLRLLAMVPIEKQNATVKVWPIDVGVRGREERRPTLPASACAASCQARERFIALPPHLEKGRTSHGLAAVALHRSGTNPDEAIRILTQIVGAHGLPHRVVDAGDLFVREAVVVALTRKRDQGMRHTVLLVVRERPHTPRGLPPATSSS